MVIPVLGLRDTRIHPRVIRIPQADSIAHQGITATLILAIVAVFTTTQAIGITIHQVCNAMVTTTITCQVTTTTIALVTSITKIEVSELELENSRTGHHYDVPFFCGCSGIIVEEKEPTGELDPIGATNAVIGCRLTCEPD